MHWSVLAAFFPFLLRSSIGGVAYMTVFDSSPMAALNWTYTIMIDTPLWQKLNRFVAYDFSVPKEGLKNQRLLLTTWGCQYYRVALRGRKKYARSVRAPSHKVCDLFRGLALSLWPSWGTVSCLVDVLGPLSLLLLQPSPWRANWTWSCGIPMTSTAMSRCGIIILSSGVFCFLFFV